MKLLVYSWFPVLAKHMIGGAQQAMHNLLTGFVETGVEVTVICPEIKGSKADLLSLQNLRILPVIKQIKGRGLFPYEHLHNLQQISQVTRHADVVWVLDCTFPLNVPQPIVLTVDNFSYKEEVESLLDLNWDMLVVPSDYLSRIAKTIASSESWVGPPRPIRVIPNAVDRTLFKPTDPSNLCARLALPKTERYLLFPHRPDPNKGFELALQTVHKLHLKGEKYRLLIPINETYKSDRRYYNKLHARAKELDIDSSVIFHKWIDLDDLPAYYSLGAWTLALSTVPEGFGLTPVQSISCGTPVICTKAGALAELFPRGYGVEYVDYQAVDQIVHNVLKGALTSEIVKGQRYVTEHYSVQQLVQGYIRCFEEVQKSDSRFDPSNIRHLIGLSPWCHLIDDSVIWHDYRTRMYKLSRKESELIRKIENESDLCLKEYNNEIVKLLHQGILWGKLPEITPRSVHDRAKDTL